MKYVLLVLMLLILPVSTKSGINSSITLARPLPSQPPIPPKNSLQDSVLNFIKYHEGFRAKPYYCSGGQLTIGYGTSVTNYRKFTKDTSNVISESQGNIALEKIFGYCKDYVTKKIIGATEGQILAISHLAYCLGTNHKAVTKIISQHNKNNIDIGYWLYVGGKQAAKYRFFELMLYKTHTTQMKTTLSCNLDTFPFLHLIDKIGNDFFNANFPYQEIKRKDIIIGLTVEKLIIMANNSKIIYKNPKTSIHDVNNVLKRDTIKSEHNLSVFVTIFPNNTFGKIVICPEPYRKPAFLIEGSERNRNMFTYSDLDVALFGKSVKEDFIENNLFVFKSEDFYKIGLIL